MRYFVTSADTYPPFRVDTTILFGEEMTRHGDSFDWVMQSEREIQSPYVAVWNGSRAWVSGTNTGTSRLARVRKHLCLLTYQMKILLRTRHEPYDFYMVKNKYIIAVVVLLFARVRRKNFIFWLSYPHVEEGLQRVKEGDARYPIFYWLRGHALMFLLYRVIMRKADHNFVQSQQMLMDVQRYGVPAERMTPVPMGVSLESIDRTLALRPRPLPRKQIAGARAIVYLGTLQRSRSIDFLVRVLALVRKSYPNTVLYLVGDGTDLSDSERIQTEAANLGVADSVVVTGFLPREVAFDYVRIADVCVSPFAPDAILQSTSPTKLIEYWALSKPVVASHHPEQKGLIEQSSGGICVPHVETDFACAILTIFGDHSLASTMGADGRKFVESYRDYRVIGDFLHTRIAELVAIQR